MEISKRFYTNNISEENIGKDVRIAGLITAVRKVSGKLLFIVLEDNSGKSQVILSSDGVGKEALDTAQEYGFLDVIGRVQKSKSTVYPYELYASNIISISSPKLQLPIDMIDNTTTSLDIRLKFRPIDLRRECIRSIFRVQSYLLEGIYEHLINNNFIQVFTPSILDKGNDGGADVFKFKYFDKNAYLRQNPQLHKQLTILGGFEKIFEIGHEWRADPSKTARHISEHVDITVEEAYVNDIEDLMDFEEDLIIAGIRKVLEKGDKDLKTLKKVVEIPKKPFPRIACAELDNLLRDSAEIISEDRLSITGKARLMNSKIREKYGSKFYFLTDYPFSDVPFYSMRDEENNSITKNTYLICDGVGICSSGLREHRYKNLLRNIEDKGTKDTEWYTKFFEYGAPPHGGFSLGLERFTMQLLGLENIREASLYPRDANSIYL